MRLRALVPAVLLCAAVVAQGGPFAPPAGQPGSTAIASTNAGFVAWASGWTNYVAGTDVVGAYQTPEEALGPADCDFDDPYNVCTLGNGGQVTLTFEKPVEDTDGFDFVVFENSFNGTFLELAYVEVSEDGTNFVRFPSASWTQSPVPFMGASVDATNLDGLAGKYGGIWGQYGVNYGTPFDLASVGLSKATHIRIVDIIGDGRCFDSVREWFTDSLAPGDPIYDPHPTSVSGGFDLDALGVFVTRTYEDWALAKFPYPRTLSEDALPDGDPDHDGLVNVLEYAFATDPLRAAQERRPRPVISDGRLGIMFWRDANKTGVTYVVESSGDLLQWVEIARGEGGGAVQPSGAEPAFGVVETGEGWIKQVVVMGGNAPGERRFFRIRVMQ